MPEICAQGDVASVGRKPPRNKPTLCSSRNPLAIRHIAPPPGDVFHVSGIDQMHLEAAHVEDLAIGQLPETGDVPSG